MSKLTEIAEGWKNLVFKNDIGEEMALERGKVCEECDKLHTLTNSFYLHCAKCGCYIPAKLRSTNSKCPLGKW